MKNFKQQYRNAKKAVAQIRAGEWEPSYNELSHTHLAAYRGNLRLWLGGGAWFCEIEALNKDFESRGGPGYFGILWRHYVWWAAARRLKRNADKSMQAPQPDVPAL